MIYIYTFLASIFFARLAERSKDKDMIVLYSAISILIPAILGGLRAYGVGTDTTGYGRLDAAQALNSPSLIYFIEHNRCELVYKIIVYFTMQTLGHENWCYFFQQLITITCTYIGAWKHRKIADLPVTMLFFYLMFYNESYNAIRQCMAEAVIFMGVDTLERKEYRKFIMYVIAAMGFHTSSFVAIPLILGLHLIITSEKFNKNYSVRIIMIYGSFIILIVANTLIVRLVHIIPFLSKYAYYLNSVYAEAPISPSYMGVMFGEFLVSFLYYNGAIKNFSGPGEHNYNFEFYRYNMLFTVIYQIFVVFFSSRILAYSNFINLILLSALPRFVKEKNLKIMVSMAVLAVIVFFWWYRIVYRGFNQTYPYRSIL